MTQPSAPLPSPDQIEELVLANRILHAQRVVDGFGHVSVRQHGAPTRFLLARSMAPALVTVDDIQTYDLQGSPLDDSARPSYLERFIHAAIYAARPDVNAVVHSHSPNIIPFGVTRSRLRPVFHMCAFLGAGVARFDIRHDAGDTDLLVRNLELGRRMATALGDKPLVLMRGHGSTVVGVSVRQAVFRAVYAEVNARVQLQAQALGDVEFLSDGESALASDANDTQVDRPWGLWKQALDGAR